MLGLDTMQWLETREWRSGVLSRRSLPPINDLRARHDQPRWRGKEDILELHLSDVASFMFTVHNAMPFNSQWDVGRVLLDLGLPWGTGYEYHQSLQLNQ